MKRNALFNFCLIKMIKQHKKNKKKRIIFEINLYALFSFSFFYKLIEAI